MDESVIRAIEFSTSMFEHHSEDANAYRDEYVSMIVTYVTGLIASIGFWLTLPVRRHLFPAYAALIGGGAVFCLIFQLFWYQYMHLSNDWATEYRQQAIKLLIAEDPKPFSPEATCPEVDWQTRKEREVIYKWQGSGPFDPCVKVQLRLLTWGQITFWSTLIVLAGLAACATAYRTRHGHGDPV